ncbi:unnamed protein product [Haemonchus placei]|uniref:Uncharacterized protein n=1 Tax=Haemonchus placei TaxID=6290 RepID=A0A3P7YLQ4_HAEPC|nr:unnamed protein product [Haemonchus placei]
MVRITLYFLFTTSSDLDALLDAELPYSRLVPFCFRCVSHKPVVAEPRTVMKLEFDLDKRRQELDPCELRLRRDKLKCRVAVDYSNLMFRARMKISVVKKRSVLLFLDGCHL